MKKIFYLIILLLLLTGCQKNKEIKKKTENIKEKNIEITEEKKEGKQSIPIAFYNNMTKLTNYRTNITTGVDIGIFSVYLSNDENISYDNYAVSLYDKYLEYKKDTNLKIGYNLKYSINGDKNISHNILSVKDTKDYEGYILVFLYDDYNNRNKGFYSHIEENEENENTLVTSIKLYPQSASNEISSKITLTAFLYNSLDDFDQNNEYIGNNKYSIEICDISKTCK